MNGLRRHVRLAVLIAISAIGTGFLLAIGGRASLFGVLAALEHHRALMIAAFSAWALVANCLVLPAGSLSLLAAGALLGTFLPAAIWFLAQILTAPLIYRAGAGERDAVHALTARYLGPAARTILHNAATAGVTTSVVLRLTPVLPSAVATLIAAAAGIGLRSYLIGSVLGGWVRPAYFAGLGAAAGSLARLADGQSALGSAALWPLAVPLALAVAALAVRLWLMPRYSDIR